MVNREVNYVRPNAATLHLFPTQELTNQKVFDFMEGKSYGYEAREEGIFAVRTEQFEDHVHEYQIRFVPEEDTISIHSHSRIDADYLSKFALDFDGELIDAETVQTASTYSIGYVHPTITYHTLRRHVPCKSRTSDDEEYISYNFDGHTFDIYPDYEIVPSTTDGEVFHEFVAALNDELGESFPDPPDRFEVEELPNGWIAPLIDRTDRFGDVLEESRIPDKSTNELLDESNFPDASPNDLSILNLEVIAAGLYAIDELTPEERGDFHDAYATDEESFFNQLLTDQSGDVIPKHEFRTQPFWTIEVEEKIIEKQEKYEILSQASESYTGYDLSSGQLWRVRSPADEAWLEVRLEKHGRLADEEFPHKPIWKGIVEDADGADVSCGDEIIVHGDNLGERLE